ncbi:MAG: NAD(P)-dependent oxidoreductase [Acidobacteriia bacterium]|nr:NAD(P)-dependent oxidoreductase [Terriglobia bacterium]
MNVLVVGGAGYLGGAVVDLLLKSAHQVRVYDALLYEECYRKPVDFVYGDVRDDDHLRTELAWADALVWLAAVVGDRACDLNPDVTVRINEKSVAGLAQNFSGRIVFTSSCSIYGSQSGRTLTETSPLDPLSLYASTKLAAERYLAKKNAIVFRLGTMFGVGDNFARVRLDLVVNTFALQAIQHGKITIFGGNQFRPLLHVRDAARAVVDAIASSHTGIFNLHRQNVRISDLACQIRNHFPDLIIENVDIPARDARDYRVSSDKARALLGFRPIHSIDEGIEQVEELLQTNRLKQPDNPRYANDRYLASVGQQAIMTQAPMIPGSGGNGRAREVGTTVAIGRPAEREEAPAAA